jgi:acyl carrier protein
VRACPPKRSFPNFKSAGFPAGSTDQATLTKLRKAGADVGLLLAVKQAGTASPSEASKAAVPAKAGTTAKKSVEDVITDIIVEQLGVDRKQVKPTASLIEDLGADSLDTVELVMAVEDHFKIEITDADAEKVRKVEDFFRVVKAKLAKPAPARKK